MKYIILLFLTCLSLCLSQALLAQTASSDPPAEAALVPSEPPAPPSNVRVSDLANDDGHGIRVTWDLSPDDGAGRSSVISYDIYRTLNPNDPDSLWKKVGTVGSIGPLPSWKGTPGCQSTILSTNPVAESPGDRLLGVCLSGAGQIPRFVALS